MKDTHELAEGRDPREGPEHLLDDLDYTYTQANPGKRFGNYMIDRIAFYLVWRVMFALFLRPITYVLYKTTRDRSVLYTEVIVLMLIAFVIFFTICEGTTKGKTLGKWITGTRVVTADGSMITLKIAFLRSLCRLVPFEPFSALKTPSFPWHDRWTRTLVIVESLSNLPPEA